MKKKTLMIFSVVAILLLGCSKSGVEKLPDDGGNNGDRPILDDRSDEKMTFSGSQLSSKAEFSDNDDGTLHWSVYDNLGVYSLNASNNALIHFGSALIQNFVNTEAAFESNDPRGDWAGSGSATNVKFFAFYPLLTPTVPIYNNDKINLSLADIQSGEFGRYHTCYSEPKIMSATDVKAGNNIRFMFKPATSILRLKISIDPSSDLETITIKQLIVTIDNSKYLAGDYSLNLNNGKVEINSGKSTIIVNLATPIPVTMYSDSKYITLSILPEEANSATLSFKVITTDGKEYPLTDKLAPDQFKPGVRYNLKREFTYRYDPATTPDGFYTLDGDGWEKKPVDNDGAYTDDGKPW